jgi:putative ABC transport system ATP-binding protein
MLCISGRSGSGKTTLLNVLSGLLRPSAGRLLWHGRDVWSLTQAERAEWRRKTASVVLQDGGLVESLTAAENVLLGQVGRKSVPVDVVREALDQVGLLDRARNYPHQLSMGERERVGIARALLMKPELIILDEPTAALDRTTADAIMQHLDELKSRLGMAVVVASHDEAVIHMADDELHLVG